MQWTGNVKTSTQEEEAADSDCLRTRITGGPRKGFWERRGAKSGVEVNLVQHSVLDLKKRNVILCRKCCDAAPKYYEM